MMAAESWMDRTLNLLPSLQNNLDGLKIFRTLSVVLLQYVNQLCFDMVIDPPPSTGTSTATRTLYVTTPQT